MVDYSDIDRVNQLVGERRQVETALQQIEHGGRILAFNIGISPTGDEPVSPFMGIQVLATDMDYPPQMLETIKTLLHQREDHIASELASIGVTGAEAQARGAIGAPPSPPSPRGAVGESQPHHAPAAPHPRSAPAKPAPSKRK